MYPIIEMLNGNKIIWGVTMLLLNVGSRYVIADLGKIHESVLSNEYFKKLIIFSMFFVATRDILTSFLLSILYVILIDGIFHEKRKFCIIPARYIRAESNVSETQYLEAIKIIETYKKQASIPQETIIPQENVIPQEFVVLQEVKKNIPRSLQYQHYTNNIKSIKAI